MKCRILRVKVECRGIKSEQTETQDYAPVNDSKELCSSPMSNQRTHKRKCLKYNFELESVSTFKLKAIEISKQRNLEVS